MEENSFSDSKMDISDATTSVESAGVSPEYESKTTTTSSQPTQFSQVIVIADSVNNDSNDLTMTMTMEDENNRISSKKNLTRHDDKTQKNEFDQNLPNALDNRFKLPIVSKQKMPVEKNIIEQEQEQQQQQLLQPQFQHRNEIARTLANSHPLMSPPGTDSDSEQSKDQTIDIGGGVGVGVGVNATKNAHKYKSGTHFNFPDVVPASEYHHHNHNHHYQVANNNVQNGPMAAHNQVAILRTHSLDLLSSESEADVSQYHATVEANLQSVALISTNNTNNPPTTTTTTSSSMVNNTAAAGSGDKILRSMRTRKNGCDDITSLDSISNHSFDDDEDIEHNLASLSPTSSLADGLDDYDDDDEDDVDIDIDDDDDDDECDENGTDLFGNGSGGGFNETYHHHHHNNCLNATRYDGGDENGTERTEHGANAATPSILPQYSAAEERRNSRNWQKITLPDGRMFEIDMRVIEPYKRVLSHGGYLKAGGHNAIVIFCACHLPDRSRADYSYVMDNLFLYVVKTLEQLVTDDYVLIYMHGGCNRRNVPPFPWLKKCYQLLDRRLRKSLKSMYLVHPTFWVKSIVWMARPFVSVKFWRKLIYVKSLEELSKHVSVEKAAIPEKVKQYDAKHT